MEGGGDGGRSDGGRWRDLVLQSHGGRLAGQRREGDKGM